MLSRVICAYNGSEEALIKFLVYVQEIEICERI